MSEESAPDISSKEVLDPPDTKKNIVHSIIIFGGMAVIFVIVVALEPFFFLASLLGWKKKDVAANKDLLAYIAFFLFLLFLALWLCHN